MEANGQFHASATCQRKWTPALHCTDIVAPLASDLQMVVLKIRTSEFHPVVTRFVSV